MSQSGSVGRGHTLNAGARADLVFPLGGHNLGVGSRDVDVGVHARLVVSLDDVAAEDLAGTHAAVVWALRGREAVLGPAIRPALSVEEGVLLLQTEPETVLLVLVHDHGGIVAEVVLVGRAVGHVRLAHDQDVVTQTEGVRVHGDGAKVDIRVVAGSLARRGAVEIPFGQIRDGFGLLEEGLGAAVRTCLGKRKAKRRQKAGCGCPSTAFIARLPIRNAKRYTAGCTPGCCGSREVTAQHRTA